MPPTSGVVSLSDISIWICIIILTGLTAVTNTQTHRDRHTDAERPHSLCLAVASHAWKQASGVAAETHVHERAMSLDIRKLSVFFHVISQVITGTALIPTDPSFSVSIFRPQLGVDPTQHNQF